MEYRRDEDALIFDRQVDTYRFSLAATAVRQERTGIHARVAISLNGVDLSWGVINIDKDEDRVRLSNSAYKMIVPEYRKNGLTEYPTDYLRKDLNDFCRGLWAAKVDEFTPEEFAGAETREAPAFILKPFMLNMAGMILYGPPGRGKSYIMLLLAVCLDAGLTVPWDVPKRQKVLIINLERSAWSLAQRLGNVNRVLGLPANRNISVLNARGRSLEDVLPAVRRYVKKHSIDVIFLDSLSRAGLGDMNANDRVNMIVDRLNSFPTWLALGHTPRGDASHIFGSQMFEAAADITIKLVSQQEDSEDGKPAPLGIGLELDKRNDVPQQRMQILALEFDELGLSSLRPARPGEFPDVEAGRKMSMRQVVMQFLLDCDGGVSDAGTVAEATSFSRENISRMFNNDRQHFVSHGKDGRKALYGVADQNSHITHSRVADRFPGAS